MGVCVSVCVCVVRRFCRVFHAFLASFSCVGWFGHKCLITCTDKFGETCVKREVGLGRCVDEKMEKRKDVKRKVESVTFFVRVSYEIKKK